MINWSRGAELKDAHPERRTAESFREFLDQIELDPDRTTEKAKSPYLCGPMSGRRGKEQALPWSVLAVDADYLDPEAVSAWNAFWQPFEAGCWPTHSNQPLKPRQRALVALERPASRDEILATGRVLADRLMARFGPSLRLDRSTFRCEQPVFLPPAGAPVSRHGGLPLSVETTRIQGDIERTRTEERTEEDRSLWKTTEGHPYSLEDCIALSLPTTAGGRNAALFKLARLLRGHYPDLSRAELREVVVRWHQLALPVIQTKEFAETWADFIRGHSAVRFPAGQAVMTVITQGFKDDSLPSAVSELQYGEQAQNLIRLCIRLARYAAPEPFFISCRIAAAYVGGTPTGAGKCLNALKLDGVLEIAEAHTTRTASRFRLGPLLTQTLESK